MAYCKCNNWQDLQAEKELYERGFYLDSGHWMVNPLFVSRERHWLQNDVQKIRFYGQLYRYIRNKKFKNNARILLAPVGDGSDLKYLQNMYREVHGIDISPAQLLKCPKLIVTREGDILGSGYGQGVFDVLIVPLFLHHLQGARIEPFIREFNRLLNRGGVLAIIEPSSFYPFGWLMALLEKMLGDFPGKVKGERPISPFRVERALRDAGFSRIGSQGMSFNHIVFPSFLQSFINMIDFPLRRIWPFKYFSITIGFFCEKP